MTVFVIIVIIAFLLIVISRKKKNGNDNGAGEDSSAWMPDAAFPLTPYSMAGEYSTVKGSYGKQIRNLQMIASRRFGCKLQADGKFGDKSEAAFRKCFGFPYVMPYSESVYESIMNRYPIEN